MSFDQLAPHYRWMEAVLAGGLIQRCRTRWLSEAGNVRTALLVGEGNGRFLESSLDALPDCEFVVVDSSPGMLAQARRRLDKRLRGRRVEFQCVTLGEMDDGLAIDRPFDLIVTHFFLDCFNSRELPQVIRAIAAHAAPSARWLVSDFVVPPAGWRRLRAQLVLALAYGFFRIAAGVQARAIEPPDAFLRDCGFVLEQRATINAGLLQADLWIRHASNPLISSDPRI